jgi:SAM-dependent methyltransferase
MEKTFVELAQGCTDAAAFEQGALAALNETIGFDVAYFSVKGLETEPTVSGLPDETVQRAVAGAATYAREFMPVKQAALGARGVAIDTDVLGVSRVRKAHYYNDVAMTVGGGHALMAYVPFRRRVVAAVMLGRTTKSFSRAEVSAVEQALPSLGVARGSYGYPVVFEPLPRPHDRGLLERLGLAGERPLASLSTLRGTVRVRDRDGFREMVASGGASELVWTRAHVGDPARSGWPYVELFHVAAGLARQRRRALFVGCGGAVALRQFARAYPGIAIDLVEREHSVVELARAWYALDSIPGVSVHIADGVNFIERASRASWDLVVIDAYDSETCSPRFARRAFFAALRESLRPGGAAAFNVIGALASDGIREVVRSALAELDEVRLVPVVSIGETFSRDTPRNVVVIGTRGA